jgi:hypothetical protein
MMVAEVMVTVGKAAARAAVVAALYNVLSADAPVGAPPEGNAKEVTRRRRRVTTTVSRNDDDIMATGSLPAALSLPAAISGGCARLTPPCATALLDLRCTLGALVAPRLRHRLVLLLLLLNRPPCATRLAGALRPLAVRALYACERVDLGTNGCVLEGGIGRDEGATRTVRTLSSSIYLGSKNGQGMDKFTVTPLVAGSSSQTMVRAL